MEYASGGELFGHILARKYLKEPEASKYFSQLIVGVSYLHNHGIVHRDLKLENLLLDKNRNIIITDFGFANRFSKETDDLLSTSCGSPCYAAPELVVNDCYVGEAADIWSCGVILYAIICGYLPFDDDPANAEGDNINLLYKYILETKLQFPSHVSPLAKSLVNRILVTDPTLRANMDEIMAHKWLEPCRSIFIEEERINPTSFKRSTVYSTGTTSHKPLSPVAENPLPYHSTSYDTESMVSNSTTAQQSTAASQPPALVEPEQELQRNFSLHVPPTQKSMADTKRNSFDIPKGEINRIIERQRSRAHSLDNPRPYAPPTNLDETFIELKEQKEQKEAVRDRARMKYHSGPIDKKALTSATPQKLLFRINSVLKAMKLEVIETPDPFKLKVIKQWEEDDIVSDVDSISITPKRDINSLDEKRRRSKIGSALAVFPVQVINRIKYMGIFGLQYNRGYDGHPTKVPIKQEQSTDEPIKMYVMIHRLHNLDGLLTVDLKRARGDIWEFKRLYQEFISKLKIGIDNDIN